MTTIWKFKLDIKDEQLVEVPFGGTILHVDNQYDHPTMWVEVEVPSDGSEPQLEVRRIRMIGTGHIFDSSGTRYLGTVIIPTGLANGSTFVWHIYEKVR